MINQFMYCLCILAITGCSSSPVAYEPQTDVAEIEATKNLFKEESTRIEPVKEFVKRKGRQLFVRSNNGKVQTFTNSLDTRCDSFDCDWFSYDGLYANEQFFKISSLSGEFYEPDYLVSRKSGFVTNLVGSVSNQNLSPNGQYIANAVGGDTGPNAGIYVWQIEAGELHLVYEYVPKGAYANYRIHNWVNDSTVAIEDEAGYEDSCKTTENPNGWSKSQLLLTVSHNGWLLKKTSVECIVRQ